MRPFYTLLFFLLVGTVSAQDTLKSYFHGVVQVNEVLSQIDADNWNIRLVASTWSGGFDTPNAAQYDFNNITNAMKFYLNCTIYDIVSITQTAPGVVHDLHIRKAAGVGNTPSAFLWAGIFEPSAIRDLITFPKMSVNPGENAISIEDVNCLENHLIYQLDNLPGGGGGTGDVGNIGIGTGDIMVERNDSLLFRRLAGQGSVTVTTDGDSIIIFGSGTPGGGETNTMQNVGGAPGEVYQQKIGVDFRMKTIGGLDINIINGTDTIGIDASLLRTDIDANTQAIIDTASQIRADIPLSLYTGSGTVPADVTATITDSLKLGSLVRFDETIDRTIFTSQVGIGTVPASNVIFDVAEDRDGIMQNRFFNTSLGTSAAQWFQIGESLSRGGQLRYYNRNWAGGPTAFSNPEQFAILSGSQANNGIVIGTQAFAPLNIAIDNTVRAHFAGTGQFFLDSYIDGNFINTSSDYVLAIDSITGAVTKIRSDSIGTPPTPEKWLATELPNGHVNITTGNRLTLLDGDVFSRLTADELRIREDNGTNVANEASLTQYGLYGLSQSFGQGDNSYYLNLQTASDDPDTKVIILIEKFKNTANYNDYIGTLADNEIIGEIMWSGSYGSGGSNAGRIRMVADESWAGPSHGGRFEVGVTRNGIGGSDVDSTRLTLYGDGQLQLHGYNAANFTTTNLPYVLTVDSITGMVYKAHIDSISSGSPEKWLATELPLGDVNITAAPSNELILIDDGGESTTYVSSNRFRAINNYGGSDFHGETRMTGFGFEIMQYTNDVEGGSNASLSITAESEDINKSEHDPMITFSSYTNTGTLQQFNDLDDSGWSLGSIYFRGGSSYGSSIGAVVKGETSESWVGPTSSTGANLYFRTVRNNTNVNAADSIRLGIVNHANGTVKIHMPDYANVEHEAPANTRVATFDASGYLYWSHIDSIVPPAASPLTFTNGLTEASDIVKWGGPLSENTTIDAGFFNITFSNMDNFLSTVDTEWRSEVSNDETWFRLDGGPETAEVKSYNNILTVSPNDIDLNAADGWVDIQAQDSIFIKTTGLSSIYTTYQPNFLYTHLNHIDADQTLMIGTISNPNQITSLPNDNFIFYISPVTGQGMGFKTNDNSNNGTSGSIVLSIDGQTTMSTTEISGGRTGTVSTADNHAQIVLNNAGGDENSVIAAVNNEVTLWRGPSGNPNNRFRIQNGFIESSFLRGQSRLTIRQGDQVAGVGNDYLYSIYADTNNVQTVYLGLENQTSADTSFTQALWRLYDDWYLPSTPPSNIGDTSVMVVIGDGGGLNHTIWMDKTAFTSGGGSGIASLTWGDGTSTTTLTNAESFGVRPGDAIDAVLSGNFVDLDVNIGKQPEELTPLGSDWVLIEDGAGNREKTRIDSLPVNIPVSNSTVELKFSNSTTSADPGAGFFRMDDAVQSDATEVYVSETTDNGYNWSFILDDLKPGDEILIQQKDDGTRAHLLEIDPSGVVDNGTWRTIHVSVVSSGSNELQNNRNVAWTIFGEPIPADGNGIFTGTNSGGNVDGSFVVNLTDSLNIEGGELRLRNTATGTVRPLHVYAPNSDFITFRMGADEGRNGAWTWDNTTPKMIFNTSSNLYPIDFHGSEILFSPGASEAMRVASDGRVGIGTSTPADQLEVVGGGIFARPDDGGTLTTSIHSRGIAGTADGRPTFILSRARGTQGGETTLLDDDAMGAFFFGGYDGSTYQYSAAIYGYVDGTPTSGSATPGRISFVTGTNSGDRTERMVIKSGGNIGVGTTDPDHELDIYDNANGGRTQLQGNNIVVERSIDAANAPFFIARKSRGTYTSPTAAQVGDDLGTFSFAGHDGTGWNNNAALFKAIATETFSAGNNGASLNFFTTDNGTSANDLRMIIDHTGFVGIGTADPITNFMVQLSGSAPDPDMVQAGNDGIFLAGEESSVVLRIANASSTGTHSARIALGSNRGTLAVPTPLQAGDQVARIAMGSMDADGSTRRVLGGVKMEAEELHATGDMPTRLIFEIANNGTAVAAEAMRIDMDGDVGIGETNPTARLHVSGGTQVILGNFPFNSDQGVGPGNDGMALIYNHSTGEIELQTIAGGGSDGNGIFDNGNNGSNTPAGMGVGITDNLNFDSGTFYIDGTNNRIGILQTAPEAPLHVGGLTSLTSANTGIFLARNITTGGNAHGITIESTFSTPGATDAYSAFDALVTVGGTANKDHMNGFQSRNRHSSTGTTAVFRDIRANSIIESGTITDWEHVSITSRQTGGTVISEYGLRIENMDKGTTANYAIYTNAGDNYFGDNVGINDLTPPLKLSVIEGTSDNIARFVGANAGQFNIRNSEADVIGMSAAAGDQIAFYQGATEWARFDLDGDFGVGTNAPGAVIDAVRDQNAGTLIRADNSTDGTGSYAGFNARSVGANAYIRIHAPTSTTQIDDGANHLTIENWNSGIQIISNRGVVSGGNDDIVLKGGGFGAAAERMRVGEFGVVVMDANNSGAEASTDLHVKAAGANMYVEATDAMPGTITLFQDDGAAMAAGDVLGSMDHGGSEDASSTLHVGSQIRSQATELWSSTNNGTELLFYTTANGSNVLTERLMIGQDGFIGVNTDAPGGFLQVDAQSYPTIPVMNRTGVASATIDPGLMIKRTSSNNVTGAMGAGIDFVIEDDAATENINARIGSFRSGADNSGGFRIMTVNASAVLAAFELDNLGQATWNRYTGSNFEGTGLYALEIDASGVMTRKEKQTAPLNQTSGTVDLDNRDEYLIEIDMVGASSKTIVLNNPISGQIGYYTINFLNADDTDSITWPGTVDDYSGTDLGTHTLGTRFSYALYWDGTTYKTHPNP